MSLWWLVSRRSLIAFYAPERMLFLYFGLTQFHQDLSFESPKTYNQDDKTFFLPGKMNVYWYLTSHYNIHLTFTVTIDWQLFTIATSRRFTITSSLRALSFECTCLHSHTASLGGAVGQPCAGSCADSRGSWRACSCCAFGCGWWGWSSGWILCRTPCTRVVSHLREDEKVNIRQGVVKEHGLFCDMLAHLCVWTCVSSCLTSGGTSCHSTGRGRAACLSGWGGVWTGWTSAWTPFHTPCSQSSAPGHRYGTWDNVPIHRDIKTKNQCFFHSSQWVMCVKYIAHENTVTVYCTFPLA